MNAWLVRATVALLLCVVSVPPVEAGPLRAIARGLANVVRGVREQRPARRVFTRIVAPRRAVQRHAAPAAAPACAGGNCRVSAITTPAPDVDVWSEPALPLEDGGVDSEFPTVGAGSSNWSEPALPHVVFTPL